MSSVDNRIVEMQFNNRRFEENARETMSTLDRLKEKLSFKSSTKELQEFQNASDSFNLSHIASAVDQIGNKFTLLGNIGQQAMQRIASAALDMGTNLIKSISIDQMSAGMQKYEQETNTVQALYAALKPKGKSLDDIYSVLDQLTAYSDETSYSYAQMADGVSKFVAAGQDINKSEIVMEGIANAAALAGVSIQDAQIAFRNFSDAMGKGYFQLQDWKSIQNIHMDTEAFKNEVLETAAALGKLKKKGDKFFITTGSGKNQKEEEISAANFGEYLRYGFFDRDVIMETMTKYADRTTELGDAAFKAAQQAKTFTDVLDAVKDAASTGWKTSFKLIFGDLEEAIALFTPMANSIIEVVNAIDEARNTMLSSWKGLGGRDSMIGILQEAWSLFRNIGDAIGFALNGALYDTFFPTWDKIAESQTSGGIWNLMGEQLAKFTEKLRTATETLRKWLTAPARLIKIQRIFKGIFSVVALIGKGFEVVWTVIKSVFGQLVPIIDPILSIFADLGNALSGLNKDLSKSNAAVEFGQRLAKAFEPITSRLPQLIEDIRGLATRVWDFLTTNPRVVAFTKSAKDLFNAFIDFVPKAIESVINWVNGIVDMVKESDEFKALKENFDKYVVPLADKVVEGATEFNKALTNFFNTDTSDEDTYWGKIKKRFGAFDEFGKWVTGEWDKLKEKYPLIKQFDEWLNGNPFIAKIKEFFGKLWESFDSFMSLDTSDETSIVGKIGKRFEAMWAVLGPYLDQLWTEAKTKYPFLQKIEDFIHSIFGSGEAQAEAGDEAEAAGGLITKLQPILDKLKEFGGKVSEWAATKDAGDFLKIGAMVLGLIEAVKLLKGFADWASLGSKIGEAIENFGEILEAAKKSIKTNDMVKKATMVVEIAAAFWLLADSLVKISSLNWDEIAKGLVGMGGIFLEELGFIAAISFMEKHGTPVAKLKSGMMVAIGLNMELMADSLKKIAEIGNWENIAQGLVGMGGIFVEEIGFMAIMGFAEKHGISTNVTSMKTLVGIGLNMELMADSLKKLSEIGDWEKIKLGLEAMGLIFAEEAGFMIVVGAANKIGLIGGLSLKNLIGVAANMKGLADTLLKLSGLTLEQSEQALKTMGLIFAEEAGFMIVVGAAEKFLSPVSFGSLIGMAGSMWILAGIVEKLGKMKLEEARQGLSVMGVIFGEEAAFMAIVSIAQSFGGPVSFTSMIGTASSMFLLGEEVQKLGQMTWDEIGKGLTAMAGLFLETGAFTTLMNILNKGVAPNNNAMQIANGIMAGGFGALADALVKLSTLNWDQVKFGLEAMAGIFVETGLFSTIMGHVKTLGIGQAVGITLVAAAIWMLANAFEPLSKLTKENIENGLEAMGLIAAGLGVLVAAMGSVQVKIGSTISTLVTAVAVAGLIYVFALACNEIKDIDPSTILNFATSIDMVAGAFAIIAECISALSTIGLGAIIKGSAGLVIAAAAIGAAVALILALTGDAVAGFSDNIAIVGANLAQYSDQVANLNNTKISDSIKLINDMAFVFFKIGLFNFGSLETFRTELQKIGSNLKLFNNTTSSLDPERLKTMSETVKTMATNFSGIPEIGDISGSIANLGAAVKIYGDSLAGVSLDGTPNSEDLQAVITALADAAPDDSMLASIASYGTNDRGKELTNFALGLTNLGTAVASFSTSVANMTFGNMDKALGVLDKIADLSNKLGVNGEAKIDLGPIGTFSTQLNTQQSNLSNLATDIISLGEALSAFGTNMEAVNQDNLTTGTEVLGKIVELNNALPPTGGISQWITGTQSLTRFAANLRLLGDGAKAFGEAVNGSSFDAASVSAAGDALIKIAEVNAKLPKTGGISSWFTGDESLSNFSSGLSELGDGVKKFAEAFGETKITSEISKAVSFINRIAGVQVKLGNAQSWYSMNSFGSELNQAAGFFVELNNKLADVTTWANVEPFENLLNFAVDQQVKLSDTRYSRSLKDIGVQVREFFQEIWNFTSTWNDGDSGKLDKVTNSVTGIFDALNNTFVNAESEIRFTATGETILTFLMNGFKDANSKIKVQNAVNDICGAIIAKVKSYTGDGQAFYNVGTWIPAGLGDGIWGNRYVAINAAVDVMNAAITAAEKAGGIASPSKEFARLGMYSDMGFAQGLMDSIYLVDTAAGQVSQSALDTVLSDMQAIQDLPLDQLEINPTIRPVLDTSAVASRAGMIDGLLGGTRSIGFNTRQLEAQAQLLGDSTGAGINSVNQQIMALRDQLAQLEETITNIEMVVDTGALVGAMRTKIDKAMGAMARRGERGN